MDFKLCSRYNSSQGVGVGVGIEAAPESHIFELQELGNNGQEVEALFMVYCNEAGVDLICMGVVWTLAISCGFPKAFGMGVFLIVPL